MDLVEDFAEPGVSMVAACSSLGVSRATCTEARTLRRRWPFESTRQVHAGSVTRSC